MLRLVTSTRLKTVAMITLLAVYGAGFSYHCPLSAQNSEESVSGKSKSKSGKKSDKKKKIEEAEEKTEELFLPEEEANQKFLPDIYRCPECGYEQDEPGFCPDHNEVELVKILAAGRDPLEPSELDGNEDILVDIPLKNLEFRKEAVLKNASDSPNIKPEKK
jgi:hypothetical protein